MQQLLTTVIIAVVSLQQTNAQPWTVLDRSINGHVIQVRTPINSFESQYTRERIIERLETYCLPDCFSAPSKYQTKARSVFVNLEFDTPEQGALTIHQRGGDAPLADIRNAAIDWEYRLVLKLKDLYPSPTVRVPLPYDFFEFECSKFSGNCIQQTGWHTWQNGREDVSQTISQFRIEAEGKNQSENFDFQVDLLMLVGLESGIKLPENRQEICSAFNLEHNDFADLLRPWCDRTVTP